MNAKYGMSRALSHADGTSARAAVICLLIILLHSISLAQEPPTPEQIEQAVKQLGAGDFQGREAASLFLWQAGRAAERAVSDAAQSQDDEVAFRAKAILEKIRLGISPDTPPEVIAMINSYRTGKIAQKQEVLSQLSREKKYRTILTLLQTETDEKQKTVLLRLVLRESNGLIETTLKDGDFELAEDLLKLATFDDGDASQFRDYAAFLWLTNRFDETFESLQQEMVDHLADPAAKQKRLMLAYFYAIRGEYQKAKLLVPTETEYDAGYRLLADVTYRMRAWSSLVDMVPGDQGLEKLGFTAAYCRRAGNRAGFEQAITGLKQLAIDTPRLTYMCSEALMINDCWQDAIDLHSKRKYDPMAFQILCEQSRFEDAFALISLEDPRTKATDWFAETEKDFDPSDPLSPPRALAVSFHVAKALDFLGERKQSIALLKAIAALPDVGKGSKTRVLLAMEIDLGMNHLAFQHAEVSLQKTELRDSVYHGLFYRQIPIAKSLDEWFPPSKDLDVAKLFKLLRPKQDELMEKAQLREIVDQCVKRVNSAADDDPSGGKMSQVATMRALGELALIHRQNEIARECFEKLQTLEPSAATAMQIADLFAKESNWTAAASNYDSVWQIDPTDPLPLYLCGHALMQAGEHDKGQQKIDLAILLPLANSERRDRFAIGLDQRGFSEEALVQWELTLRFGEIRDGSDAAEEIARHIRETDPLGSAWLLECEAFKVLRNDTCYSSVEQYGKRMAIIHSTRAKGLLRERRVDEALAEIELSLNARIDQVDATIDFVQGMEENDRAADAQQVFNKVANRFKELLQRFPNCSHFHNNLAWLMACCDRELDNALTHATAATRLAPDNAVFLDTLAEVHFRKGDLEKAVDLSQKALRIDPDSTHLKEKLERFSRIQVNVKDH